MNRKEKEEIKKNQPINEFKTERMEKTLNTVKKRKEIKEKKIERRESGFCISKISTRSVSLTGLK